MPSPTSTDNSMIYGTLTLVPPENAPLLQGHSPLPSTITCNIDHGIRSHSDYTQICRRPLLRCKYVNTSND